MEATSPVREYESRFQIRSRQAERAIRREKFVGNLRVVIFFLAVVLAYLAFFAHWFHPLWLVPVVLLFLVLLFLHESVDRALHRAIRARMFYLDGLARLADQWKGKGTTGTRFLDETHPYAADLDLFGAGSLFELLCTARTRTGENTLAQWLLQGATPEVIRERQAAIAELRPQLDLREELALLGSDLPAGVDFDTVVHWGATPPILRSTWPRWVALVLGITAIVCLVGWLLALVELIGVESGFGAFFDYWRSTPLAIVILLELLLASWLYRRVQAVLHGVEKRGRDLALLASVLACLEQARFSSPLLNRLHRELTQGDGTDWMPSERIAQLGSLIDVLNSRRNQFFMPFALLLMWGTQLAYAIEKWRRRTGPVIGRWLMIVGEMEALCALATYAFENPDDPFPEIVEQGPLYEGVALAHPLLPRGKCVPNDLFLSNEKQVLIVSGSNMSGKSTFLRTIGINAVLALAGSPVRCRRMRISPLVLGATLRIQDSLQAGRSRFYAEILRVRQVVELSRGPIPLLFLLDEIFAGTNSHDRCVGAEAVVRGLVEAGAIGLVTTHDLTLTRIAELLGSRGSNVHFADHFENGVMQFDYQLHPGVVQNSNALALMRAVGLQV